ncbi:MAG: mechanosensitive ion channel family protein [Oscillospiraceae bacterium]|jgi:small-conductance mechanosensitive channel|nr:mechanosensitive ion channel family protein [Oscillospiraceae bacterium]
MGSLLEKLGITNPALVLTLRIVLAVLVCTVAIMVIKSVSGFIEKRDRVKAKHLGHLRLVRYVLTVVIVLAAVMTVFSGSAKDAINKTLAGSGIIAVVLSIACQEPIGNLCSGLILILTQPFRVGDIVRYIDDDIVGYVVETNLMHTIIRTFENRRVIVPNSVLNKSSLENWSYRQHRINEALVFTVTYNSDYERGMEEIRDAVMSHPNFSDARSAAQKRSGDPAVEVAVSGIEERGVNLRVRIWADNAEILYTMKSDILIDILRRFEKIGVSLAYPTQTVVIGKEVQP